MPIALDSAAVVPLTDSPRQSLLLPLGGQEVALAVHWAPLTGLWYLTIEVAGVRVAGGRQITAQARLIRERGFAGDLIALPPATTPLAAAPGRMAWVQDGWRLIWLTPEQVTEADATDRWL